MEQTAKEPAKCIECSGQLYPIKVVEATHGNAHAPLKYAAVDAQADWFFGRYPVHGELSSEVCGMCGRVYFRAVPVVARVNS